MSEPPRSQWLAEVEAPTPIDTLRPHTRFTTTQHSIFGKIRGKATKDMEEVRKRIGSYRKPFPVDPDNYSALLSRSGASSSKYGYVDPEALSVARKIAEINNDALRHFNIYAKLNLVCRFSIEESKCYLPISITDLYLRELARIGSQVSSLSLHHHDLGNDAYLKDIAILTHRLVPVGAEFAALNSGIPRRILFTGGIEQFKRLMKLIVCESRGFAPFFELHLHDLALHDFNQEGMLRTYRCLAELLTMNPSVKGWLSSSWFLDPNIQWVSPHLAHLSRIPMANGAVVSFVRWDREGKSGALRTSTRRRKLFDDGKYVPAIYMRIWPRRTLIEWSKRTTPGSEQDLTERTIHRD